MDTKAPVPKVGDPIWFFDLNCRTYRQVNGRSVGGPIWRKHWRENRIVGETKISWIIGHPGARPEDRGCVKIKKTELSTAHGYCLSEKALDDMAWIEENRNAISDKVRAVKDVNVLRQIASLLGHVAIDTDEVTLAGTGF